MSESEIFEKDVATSSDAELAEWCRMLGLDGTGGKNEMAARLREYYKYEAPAPKPAPQLAEGEKPPLVITIDSARTTEYFTIKAVDEEYVRLRGDVQVSLKDGNDLHTLKAQEILYNRTRNLMTASGGVEYNKKAGDTLETFRGAGITVNLDDWTTVFSAGISEKSLTSGTDAYRFSGEVISRTADGATILKNAVISNANEEAYWSLAASKLWLLPGSDWAVFNMVLKVGEIPILYMPAFYYPADEIVFHPVFGLKTREGTFLQTTTYIIGRPKSAQGTSEEMASITSIMGSGEGMEKKLEGVFLRSTGVKAGADSGMNLAIKADAYANLGYFAGADFTMPAKGHFGATNIAGGIAVSRDIWNSGGYYTPFYDGSKYSTTGHWHSSRIFDATVPFRYYLSTDGSVSGSGKTVSQSSLSWSFPFYSDPRFTADFLTNRSEDSDFFTRLLEMNDVDSEINDTMQSAYEWKLSGNLTFNIPGAKPYLNSFTISSITSALQFDYKSANPAPSTSLSYPPNQYFYYPKKLTLYSISASLSGTPLSLGAAAATPKEAKEAPPPVEGFNQLIPPWGIEAKEEEKAADPLTPPAISRTASSIQAGGQNFTLDWSFSPSGASELNFDSGYASTATAWQKPEDIDWSDVSSQLWTVRADGNFGLTLSEKRGLYTTSLRFSESAVWQEYSFVNETNAADIKKQAHSANRFSSSSAYNMTVRPFFWNDIFGATNFQYNLKGILAQTEYNTADDSWKWKPGSWTEKDIEAHQMQANLYADIMGKTQSLLLNADLPPEKSALSANATARAWISETNATHRIVDPFDDPTYEPVYLTETFTFHPKATLRQYAVYTPEYDSWTNLTTTLTLWDFSASFTATRSVSYYLDTTIGSSGWKQQGTDETLNPQELRLAYIKNFMTPETKKVQVGLNLNTSLAFNLQRYTMSKFTFSLGFTAKITNFLDVTMSAYSENSTIYRYFPNTASNTGMPWKNPFIDLIDSFRFDDRQKREESGFKLKSFNLDLVHHLGDWDATLNLKLIPELNNNVIPKQYEFNTEFSFLMQWKPIKQLKTKLSYDKDAGFDWE